MSHEVRVAEEATRALKRLPRPVRALCWAEIKSLGLEPRPPGVGRLKGRLRAFWRIRIGDHRIAYRIDEGSGLVLVEWAGHRSRIYEELERKRTQA